MAYAYTDEELDRLYPELPDDGRGGWSRLLNAVYRLRCERDELRELLAVAGARGDQAENERDEARRVARGLAKVLKGDADDTLELSDVECEVFNTALAYPEVKP